MRPTTRYFRSWRSCVYGSESSRGSRGRGLNDTWIGFIQWIYFWVVKRFFEWRKCNSKELRIGILRSSEINYSGKCKYFSTNVNLQII